MTLHRLVTGQDQPGGAVRDLGTVARRYLAELPVKDRSQLRQFFYGTVRPDAVIVIVIPALSIIDNFYFLHTSFPAGCFEAQVALHGVFIHAFPADGEAIGQFLGGLTHVQPDHGVC